MRWRTSVFPVPPVRSCSAFPSRPGLAVFCVGGALVIGALGKRADEREVATGTVLAAATGLGLFFSSLATKSSSTVTNVLFGNLLAVTHQQLVTFARGARGDRRGRRVRLPTAALRFGQRRGRRGQGRAGASAVGDLHGATRAGGDDGGSGRRARCCCSRLVVTPAATAILMTARPGAAMAVATASGRGIGVVRPHRVGDVQRAAQFRHHDHRVHGLADRLVGGATHRARAWRARDVARCPPSRRDWSPRSRRRTR